MREPIYNKVITTKFISGGMEYQVQCVAECMGKRLMNYILTKVWGKGTQGKYVRLYPYDLHLWGECMAVDMEKALQEELV